MDSYPRGIIFGIDIYSHYTKLENPFNAIYALTILEGSTIKQVNKIPKSRIIRLINSYKPVLLAVDNIYELAPNLSSLRHLFSILPSETRIIQVTGSPNNAMTLQEVAASHGLKPPSKISPLEESEACAKLAALGAGSDIQVIENETKISVCRSVSLGPGGTSQSRYRRKIHVSILTITKNIEEALNRASIDYDLFTEESDFGLERAVFHVYVPRMKLIGIVKPSQGNYVRVKITPVYRNQVEFTPRERSKIIVPRNDFNNKNKKLILGVDPGTTCGLAAITFDSYPIYIGSHRGISRGDVARIVLGLGEIIIIAADVTPAPEFVIKLAKMLSAEIFRPESLLEASEKQNIAQMYAEKYNIKIKDPHERDALVAAIKAYQHYQNKFGQLEVEIQKTGSNLPMDEAKTLIVKGFPIQKAINLLTPKKIDEGESLPKEVEGEDYQ